MSKLNKLVHILVASTLCGVLLLPLAAQAHGQRTDANKVVDATILPPRKVLHFGKKTGESAERRIGHVGKQIFR